MFLPFGILRHVKCGKGHVAAMTYDFINNGRRVPHKIVVLMEKTQLQRQQCGHKTCLFQKTQTAKLENFQGFYVQ